MNGPVRSNDPLSEKTTPTYEGVFARRNITSTNRHDGRQVGGPGPPPPGAVVKEEAGEGRNHGVTCPGAEAYVDTSGTCMFSIIVPTFNRASLCVSAVQSALVQDTNVP